MLSPSKDNQGFSGVKIGNMGLTYIFIILKQTDNGLVGVAVSQRKVEIQNYKKILKLQKLHDFVLRQMFI